MILSGVQLPEPKYSFNNLSQSSLSIMLSNARLIFSSSGLLGGRNRTGRRTASTDEIALAGRGFNSAVEAQYQSESGLDFAAVDTMEGYAGLPIEELGEFLATADLGLEEVEQ